MLRIFADDFMNIGSTLIMISHLLYDNEVLGRDLEESFIHEFRNTLIDLKNECDKLGLKVSSILVEKSINDLPQNHRELEVISRAIKAEIRSNLFLYIPSYKARYHILLSEFVSSPKFSESSKELVKAGNCYAVGEDTACVFHAMRAAELGLRSLAKHLGVTFPFPLELADWQNIIDKIESAIKNLNKLPKGAEKDKELQFCSAAAAQFRYFKEAYRKHVAHARESYDEHQSLSIMEHTLEFINNLSQKLSE